MTYMTEPTEQASRKQRRCSWCWQFIEVGERYKRYRYFGDDVGTCSMHHECFDAMQDAAREEGGFIEWTPGQDRPERAVPAKGE